VRGIEKSRIGNSLEKREEEEGGGDYTACGLESTHEQVARRDLPRGGLGGWRKEGKSGKYDVCDEIHAGTVKEDTLNSFLVLLLFLLPFMFY